MNSLSSPQKTTPLLNSATTELQTLFQDVCPQGIALPSIPQSSPKSSPTIDSALAPEPPSAASWLPSLCLRLVWGVSGVGAIVLTLTVGVLGGAILAQRYAVPNPSLANLTENLTENPTPAIEAIPALEKVFRYTAAQRDRLQTWIPVGKPQDSARLSELTIAPNSLTPEILAQWEPDALALEIDRLQTEAQALETQVSALETKLNLDSAARQRSSMSARLNSIDRALNSGSTAPMGLSVQRPLEMTLPTDILFEEGKAVFKPEAIEFLNNLADTLNAELATVNAHSGTNFRVTIATHTDDVGSEAANLNLSFQRSQLLENQLNSALSRFGFNQLTWNTLGYGETAPLADNSTSSNRQRNRRVELTIRMD